MPKLNSLTLLLCSFLFLISMLTGCDNSTKEPTINHPLKDYYTDEEKLNIGVDSIFTYLYKATRDISILAAYAGADDISTPIYHSKFFLITRDLFDTEYENSRILDFWESYYKTIFQCNSFIQLAHPKDVDQTIINNKHANAHFVRGLLYFKLACIFGDIPMPLTVKVDSKEAKTPMRDVLQQCIKDFEYANEWAVNARDNNPNAIDRQVSKTAAKALMAKCYMQLTGWPFNEKDKWTNVKTLTQSIIDDGVYSLMDDIAHNFQDPHQNNKEIIFAHICVKNNMGETPTHSRYYGWVWAEWMDVFLEWNYYNNFPAGYRKEFSTDINSAIALREEHPIITKFSYATIKDTPEFVHTWQSSNDMPIMRYSEVLLMYAEACAQLAEPQEAIAKLNMVKRRAYAKGAATQEEVANLEAGYWMNPDPEVDYTSSDLTTNQDIIDAIVLERAYEFMGEPNGNRWLDLIRLEMVGEVNTLRDARESQLIGDPFDKTLWFAIIPTSDVLLNPAYR